VIFIDANVFIYTVGRHHPLKREATSFFDDALAARAPLVTSAEVLQELLHYYRVQGRVEGLGEAWALAEAVTETVWDVTHEDVALARALGRDHDALSARDLVHLACCRRRKATGLKTYDKGLAAAWAA
jgi:predicted nucleic acid-binding protein